MAKSEKTQKASARENLLSRARERFPDRTFADLGTEPAEGVADLDEAIDEMLTDFSTRQKTYDENNRRLSELMISDPSAAEFVQRWVETGDPRTALVDTFGDELGMSEEGQSKFKDQLTSWRERKSANDALESEAENNWQNSLAALKEWGDTKGLTLEKQRDVMLRLLSITFNGMENKYGPEDFDMAYNAINHDNDVAAARAEGEVTGRNEKIAATRRARTVAANNMPPSAGRQGGSMVEPQSQKRKSFWGEVNEG